MLASLKSRLVLSNLLITLVGMAIIVLVFTQLLAQRSVDVKRHELRQQSTAFAGQVERLFRSHGAPNQLRTMVDSASNLLGERVVIVGPRGDTKVDSANRTPYFKGKWLQPDQGALSQARSASSALRNKSLVLFQTPIRGTNGHSNGGAVILVAHVTDVNPGLTSLFGIILGAGLTALLIWLLLAVYSTFSLFRPLLRVTEATARMARGDYNVRVKTRGTNEISRLSRSFNEMAEQVQRTNQVLRDFLANVSHDLRTPLTMIAGFSQAIVDGTVRSADVEESAAIVHDEALKMQRMVDDLLQLTRLESGLLTLDKHPTKVRPFAQSVIDRAARAHDMDEGPTLVNDVPSRLPAIDVDATQMERALSNLVHNAIQYTPPDGMVTITGRAVQPGLVEIGVSDTGPGIPSQDLPRIFERFYRSDKSRERLHGHSGLGLAIVREIVEAHGGTVSAESEPGRGSTFRIRVPAAQAIEPGAETSSGKSSVRQALTG